MATSGIMHLNQWCSAACLSNLLWRCSVASLMTLVNDIAKQSELAIKTGWKSSKRLSTDHNVLQLTRKNSWTAEHNLEMTKSNHVCKKRWSDTTNLYSCTWCQWLRQKLLPTINQGTYLHYVNWFLDRVRYVYSVIKQFTHHKQTFV